MKLETLRQNFEKYTNTKFHENLSSDSRLSHMDGRTDRWTKMTKLVVAFCNFAKTSKNYTFCQQL